MKIKNALFFFSATRQILKHMNHTSDHVHKGVSFSTI